VRPSPSNGGDAARFSRSGLVRRAVAAALVGIGADRFASSAKAALANETQSAIRSIAVRSGGKAFHGDRPHFATINPRSSTGRRFAELIVDSNAESDAFLEVVSRHGGGPTVISRTPTQLRRGVTEIPWKPPSTIAPGSYFLRLRSDADNVPGPVLAQAVVRVLDVEARFTRRGAAPGDTVHLSVLCDAPWLRMTLARAGSEDAPTYSNSIMNGVPVAPPQRIDLRGHRDAPLTYTFQQIGRASCRERV